MSLVLKSFRRRSAVVPKSFRAAPVSFRNLVESLRCGFRMASGASRSPLCRFGVLTMSFVRRFGFVLASIGIGPRPFRRRSWVEPD